MTNVGEVSIVRVVESTGMKNDVEHCDIRRDIHMLYMSDRFGKTKIGNVKENKRRLIVPSWISVYMWGPKGLVVNASDLWNIGKSLAWHKTFL